MKQHILVLLVLPQLALASFAWSQCPEDPNDLGQCDTIYAEAYEPGSVSSFPASVPIMFRVTHDLSNETDSLAGFLLPIRIIERTNPGMFCSISTYWNWKVMIDIFPGFDRSIFRHVGGIQNRMATIESDFSQRGWDFVYLDLGDQISQFFFTISPAGTPDQRWWEGSRVLLVTATLRAQDTMTVCIDSTFWPPAFRLTVSNFDASTFIPRHNLPYCFKVDCALYVRGDANGSGTVEFGDVVYLINYLFRFDSPPDPYEAGDANCDGTVEFGDVIYLINYLFRFGPPPGCP